MRRILSISFLRALVLTRLRRAAVALPVSLALVVVLLPASGCSRRPAPAPAQKPAAAAPAPRVPTGSEVFASATTSLTTSLESARRALSRGSTDATAIAAVRDFATTLPELDKGVQADFAKTRDILAKVGSKEKDAIEARVERTYAKRRDALARRLATVTSAESTSALKAAIASTADYLDSITPEEPYQPLGTSLPHRIVDAHAGPPVLGAKIAPAYAPNTPGATPSTLPVTPTAADTTETVEVQFSPEITALVASLGSDPVRMYEYVRNTIDFEPYYGSRKGATETLLEGSGNDIDTASLLIALYRAAGIPARYVSGVVDVPIEKAMNWVGVETPEAAAKLFASGGTPTTSMIAGGKVKALRIEHTWAEVYVPYEDYRGMGEGSGEKIWVPLDASFKECVNRDSRAMLESVIGQPSAATTDSEGLQVEVDAATAKVGSWLESHRAEARDIVRPRHPIEVVAEVLPQVLPLTSRPTREARAQDARDMVVLRLSGGSSVYLPLSEAASATILIDFEPVDQDAAAIIEGSSQLGSVPAYLVNMRPVLWVNGTAVATGSPLLLGNPVDAHVGIQCVDGYEADAGRLVTAGGKYGITIDAGGVPSERLRQTRDALEVATHRALAEDLDVQELVAPLLGAVGRTYFAESDQVTPLLASAAGVVAVHEPSALFAAIDATPRQLLGEALSIELTGMSLDVRANNYVVSARSSDVDMPRFNAAAGYASSMLEHEVFEQLFNATAVSTARVFVEATKRGVEILTLTPDNVGDEIRRLEVGGPFRAQIESVVRSGMVVAIPRTAVPVGNWNGHAWLITNPTTGDSGYMIDNSAGSWADMIGTWANGALSGLADLTAVSWVWAPNYMKQFTERSLGLTVTEVGVGPKPWLLEFCQGVAIVVMPLLATFQQAVDDIDREDLEFDERVERLLLTFISFEASALLVMGVTMLSAGAFASVFGAYTGAVVMGLCAAAFGLIIQTAWDLWKQQLFGLAGAP